MYTCCSSKKSNKERTLSFRWVQYRTYSNSCDLDDSYMTNWLTINTEDIKKKRTKFTIPATESNKYPDGYLPKIKYWESEIHKRIKNLDAEGAKLACDKVVYFQGKQDSLVSK